MKAMSTGNRNMLIGFSSSGSRKLSRKSRDTDNRKIIWVFKTTGKLKKVGKTGEKLKHADDGCPLFERKKADLGHIFGQQQWQIVDSTWQRAWRIT